jgi:hypothetical protein
MCVVHVERNSNPSGLSDKNVGALPAILRGREGRMNGQIIRYLALNGPSLIYSVAQDLASRSETKVHYPTVNRRMHELERKQFAEKAGTRMTKAGIPADLYATRLRGDFAAMAGIPDSSGNYTLDLSPKEIRQIVSLASARKGSPFALLMHMLEDGQNGIDLVDKELMPEIIGSVRNGSLNVDALDEGVICSHFALLVARKMTNLLSTPNRKNRSSLERRDQIDILVRTVEKILSPQSRSSKKGIRNVDMTSSQKVQLTPVAPGWANELMPFLKLNSVSL